MEPWLRNKNTAVSELNKNPILTNNGHVKILNYIVMQSIIFCYLFQVELGNEVMKKFRRKKKMTDGFEEKMENVFNDYFDWYFDPGENPKISKFLFRSIMYLLISQTKTKTRGKSNVNLSFKLESRESS